MTKVLKVEDTDENADLIANVNEKHPPKTIGYSLGCDKRLTVVSYKVATPPNIPQEFYVRSLQPTVEIEPLEISLNRSMKEHVKNTELISNNNNINYDNNSFDTNDGDNNNNNEYFHLRPRITDDSEPLFQVPGPGTTMLSDSGPAGAAFEMKAPDIFQAQSLLDKGLINTMDDKVCRGWMGAIKWVLVKYKVPEKDLKKIQQSIVAMIKLNLNMFLYGTEFLVKYKEACDQDDLAKAQENQVKIIKHIEQFLATFIEKHSKELPEKISADIAKLLKVAQGEPANEDVPYENISETNVDGNITQNIGNITPPTRVGHNPDDTFEIPFNDTYRTFNRYAINKMVMWYDKRNKNNTDKDGDEAMLPGTSKQGWQPFTPRGRGSRGRGGHGNYRGRGKKRFSAQEHMDNKRAKHIENARDGRLSLKEIIDRGSAEGATPLSKYKKQLAEERLEKEVDAQVLIRNRLVKNANGEYVQDPQAWNLPDDQVYVNNKGPDDKVGTWKTLKEFKDILRAQFSRNHKFDDE